MCFCFPLKTAFFLYIWLENSVTNRKKMRKILFLHDSETEYFMFLMENSMFLIENFMFLIENFMFFITNFVFLKTNFMFFRACFEIFIVFLMQLMQNTTRWSFLHQLYFCAAPLCQCKLMQICINCFEPVTFKVCSATLKRFRSSPS